MFENEEQLLSEEKLLNWSLIIRKREKSKKSMEKMNTERDGK
jgi:hypothetical protein